jgi:hypothetical protein
VEGHAYAVIGYSSVTGDFTLFNPWGLGGGSYTPSGSTTSVYCAGIVQATSPQVAANFNFGTVAGAAAIPARPMAGPIAVPASTVDLLFDDADNDQSGVEDGSHRTGATIVRRTGESAPTPVVDPAAGLFSRSPAFRGVRRLLPSTTWGGSMS